MSDNRFTALVALVSAVALSGCGSSGSNRPPRAGAGQTRTSPSSAAGGNGEAAKPPGQIVADAAAALRNAHAYVVQGTITENQQQLHLRVTVASRTSLDVAFSVDQASVEEISVPGGSYLRANRTFWTTHLGARGVALSNRWIQVQPSDAQAITSSLGQFGPTTLARCLAEDHGTLTVAGEATIAGHRAVIVKDAGDKPGSSPGTLAVATSGPPYPLQAIGAGGQRPGGHIDVCNDGKANNAHGEITFSRFGQVKPISPPAKAIRLGSLST